jgi:hypothetical protein
MRELPFRIEKAAPERFSRAGAVASISRSPRLLTAPGSQQFNTCELRHRLLAAILRMAQGPGGAVKAEGNADTVAVQIKLVAGAGFEPAAFRL